MNVTVNVISLPNVRRVYEAVGPAGRHDLLSAAATGAKILVQGHLRTEAPRRHSTADRLRARRTEHLEKGARAVTMHADGEKAVVEVPIPGITRAFHDIEIRPVKADKLTIPVNAMSYGRTAGELSALGWRLFRGRCKGANLLFGSRGEGKNRVTHLFYALKDRVTVPMDPSLLPTNDEIMNEATASMAREIARVVAKAESLK